MSDAKTAARVRAASLKIALSNLLWAELERQGITRYELAKRSGLAKQYVHDVLAGATEPSLSRAIALENGLGKHPGWLAAQLA